MLIIKLTIMDPTPLLSACFQWITSTVVQFVPSQFHGGMQVSL